MKGLFVFLTSIVLVNLQDFQPRACSCKYDPSLDATLTLWCTRPDTGEISQCFERYKDAKNLIFTNSSLLTIPGSLDKLQRLKRLDLTQNKISRVDFDHVQSVCKKIEILNLEFNTITRLFRGDFDCFSSLKKVYLANNSLSRVDVGSFSENNTHLWYLHLINNHLTHLDASLVFLPAISDRLIINASWNSISYITNDLNYTIRDIHKSDYFGLVMIHNNFTTIDMEHYLKLFSVTFIFDLLRLWNSAFDLRFNPFVCDCAMYPIAIGLKMFRFMDPINPVFSITCYQPASLRGKTIWQVDPVDFNCSVSDMCPHACKCTKTVSLDMVSVYCNDRYTLTNLPQIVPPSKNIHLNIKSSWMSELTTRKYLSNVTELDLAENRISRIDSDVLHHLEHMARVYLHENSLQTLPTAIQHTSFKTLKVLTLHGNPFSCDCHSLWLKKWLLQNRNNIPYQDKIMCGSGRGKGQILVNVADSDFVCESAGYINKLLIAISGAVVTFMILILILSRSRLSLYVIEYVNSSWCRKKLRSGHKYDIFISNSSLDDSFVHGQLIQKLKKHTPPYTIYIDEQHFIAGKTIAHNINLAIGVSHTTLLVVSNNFLTSKWCMMEFREAHLRLLRDRNINLIIIVLEDLNPEFIEDELKIYMQTHVYLHTREKYFWSKLLQALPIRICDSESSSEIAPSSSINPSSTGHMYEYDEQSSINTSPIEYSERSPLLNSLPASG